MCLRTTHQVLVLAPATATTFTRTPISVPTTMAINLHVADGRAYVGYGDTGQAGKATVARVDGGTLVPVGQARFTTGEALVGPHFSSGGVLAVLVNQGALALEVAIAK